MVVGARISQPGPARANRRQGRRSCHDAASWAVRHPEVPTPRPSPSFARIDVELSNWYGSVHRWLLGTLEYRG